MTPERAQPVTMADVAARAGVSRALVSIVLRGVPGASATNRERVLRAAAELDYHPDERARLLGSGRSRRLGVVHGLHEPFHGELLDALYAAVAGTPWRLTLEPRSRTRPEPAAVRALLDQRVEALVLLGPGSGRAALQELGARVPVVVVARALPRVDAGVVRTDDDAGARLAVEHLLALGHRRVVHVHGGRAPGAAERRAGYRRAVREAGLRPELVAGGGDGAAGEAAAAALLAGPPPEAVLAFNDECAAGLLHALRARGTAVPADVSLVGFDDSTVAALSTVSLTTVAQDPAALARHAVAEAVARVEGDTDRPEVVVAPRLVVRGTTTGRARGSG
ncbi:LacI family DNA-binding transcriptional regulator [Kineococcus radiotolerans]|uniref:Periplasmic binding protein/LacI transcriptional regulator n=1 Tax=Kineococcus radiotolerans (strain ATCC BAA-149 / DSM 14245 / SRS30216) TaxID=266940 RepID=A6WFM9_KINRD|nr:LacI family DNA-binding transcriptional regulator [Kineococcus radiotolerans]ABS05618.1 periplasmic binding protein/LacI transcriptional regulator [Kineococcus radiotolerans SRS30216 = ATCC BAA-149]